MYLFLEALSNKRIAPNSNGEPDIWIVGQGIAGTLLAHFALERGFRPLVIDDGDPKSASRLAAGIMNPVTGRHFALTWMAADLFPFARQTYRRIEERLGERFYFPWPVLRALPDVQSENDWFARAGDPELKPFLDAEGPTESFGQTVREAPAYLRLTGGGKCDLGRLVAAYREHLRGLGLMRESAFSYGEIDPENLPCPIVFCEGVKGAGNPWFGNEIPFRPSKGEVLIVRIPGAALRETVVKHDIFLVPLGDDLFWVGSNYEQKFSDDLPTPSRRIEMENALRDMLRVPFHVLEHRAAIRPTTANRRPYWGEHPNRPGLYALNGLGTKGATLGPYFANELAQRLFGG